MSPPEWTTRLRARGHHAPTLVRERLGDALRADGCPRADVDAAVLVVHELVENAVQHGRADGGADGEVRVDWWLGHTEVVLRVHNAGVLAQGDGSPARGRGLAIARGLSTELDVDVSDGVTVTARLDLTPRADASTGSPSAPH